MYFEAEEVRACVVTCGGLCPVLNTVIQVGSFNKCFSVLMRGLRDASVENNQINWYLRMTVF